MCSTVVSRRTQACFCEHHYHGEFGIFSPIDWRFSRLVHTRRTVRRVSSQTGFTRSTYRVEHCWAFGRKWFAIFKDEALTEPPHRVALLTDVLVRN